MERSPRMGVSFTRSLNVLSPIQVKGAQYTAATATNTAKKRTGEVKSVERATQGRRSMATFSAYPASADPGLSPINKLSTIKVSPQAGVGSRGKFLDEDLQSHKISCSDLYGEISRTCAGI